MNRPIAPGPRPLPAIAADAAQLSAIVAIFIAGWLVLCPLDAYAASSDLVCETTYGATVYACLVFAIGGLVGFLIMALVAASATFRRIDSEGFGDCETPRRPHPGFYDYRR